MSIRSFCNGLLAAAMVAGCGGSKPEVREERSASDGPAALDSLSAQIFSFSHDTAIAPLVKNWPAPPPDDSVDTAVYADTAAAGMVYRIQLFTSQNRAEATAMRDEAKIDFGDDVRLDFETPYYKLRLGSFASPEEAEALLRKARRMGYRGAWVVRVRAPGGKS